MDERNTYIVNFKGILMIFRKENEFKISRSSKWIIKELEQLLKGIIIKICLLGDNLTIQAKSPIMVEVKNIHNYKSILNNIKEKKYC